MDFAFSDEQQMLKDQARSFLADKWPPERLADLGQGAWDESLWKEMTDLGWVGLSVGETAGGAGMTFLEEAVLFEELGYALYAGPYFATVALALPAVAAASDVASRFLTAGGPAALAWSEDANAFDLGAPQSPGTKAEPANGNWALSGEKTFVWGADAADTFVVLAQSTDGVGLWAVSTRDGVAVDTMASVDATRPSFRVRFTAAEARLVAGPEEVGDRVKDIRLHATAAAALEAVGVAQRALDLGVAYVSERRQFERPIGEYQAVSHQLADTYVETELARSLAYWAAWCVATKDERADVAVAAAKAAASDAAVAACERSIQVHGGIGFTWEHVLHRYLKRADWIAVFSGTAADNRRRIGDFLLGG